MLRIMESTVSAYDKLGIVRERVGNRHPAVAPAGLYRSRDNQWVTILCGSDRIFARLAKAMGRPELADDERFATNARRVENSAESESLVADWVAQRTLAEVMNCLEENGVPGSPVYSIADIFQDPHYAARSSIVETEHPVVGRVKMQGVGPRLSLTPGGIDRPAPALGEHNEEIYSQLLGLSAEELTQLRSEGVI